MAQAEREPARSAYTKPLASRCAARDRADGRALRAARGGARRGRLSPGRDRGAHCRRLRIELEVYTGPKARARIPFLSACSRARDCHAPAPTMSRSHHAGEDVFRCGEPAQAMVYVLLGYMVVQDEVGTVLFSVISAWSVKQGASWSEARRHIASNPNHGDHDRWRSRRSAPSRSMRADRGRLARQALLRGKLETRINTPRGEEKRASPVHSHANLQNFIASAALAHAEPDVVGPHARQRICTADSFLKKHRYVIATRSRMCR